MASSIEIAQEALRTWKADPCRMVKDLFRATPDRWQAEALEAFPDPDPAKQRIALAACAGPGKSSCLAWVGWNFLLCYQTQDKEGLHYPTGYALSITGDNLRDNLWKELSLWRQRSPPLLKAFEMTAESIFSREQPTLWWLRARSFAKTADAEAQGRTLSGLHAKSLLYLVDESGDIPPSVGRSAEQGLGDPNAKFAKIVQAGNPTSHSGMLYQACATQRHLWHVISITADPDDANRTPRKSIEWAREQIALYGRDNPWVMAYILGKFPPSSINALLGPDEVNAALGKHLREDQYSFAQKRLGIDVARFGDDSTVLFPRQGLASFNPVELRNARSETIAGRVAMAKGKWSFELGMIDDTGGWGAGTIDSCRLGGIDLYPVNAGGKADDARYFNKRSEMNFRAAEWVKSGGALPNHARLVREATAVTYYFHEGKLRVTEKAQIKMLLGGQSPDYWDALCLTFALVELPSQAAAMVGNADGSFGHQIPHEWSPFD